MRWILDKLTGSRCHATRPATTNLERIAAIPYALLPYGSAARDDLLALAEAGKDVDAYIPVASDQWVIWCRPASPEQNGRYSIEEWKAISSREYYRLLPDAYKGGK